MAKNTHAAGTAAPAATAGVNATATPGASNSSATGGNIEPLALEPVKKGSRKSGQNDTKRDETVPASSPPPPPPPSQCLLWTDTVLSTEGHPFLISFLSAGKAAATKAANADALAAAQTETEETTPATRGNVDPVDAAGGRKHKPRENNRPPLGSSDPERCPSASTLASAPEAPDTVAIDAGAAVGTRKSIVLDRVMSTLRRRRRQIFETTGSDLDFDPRQHYARAVNRKGFKKGPRNAELDVMVRAIASVQFKRIMPCGCVQALLV